MSTRIITGVALTGVLVLASCMQDSAKAPLVPTGPSLVKAASCPFTAIRNDAKSYLTNNRTDPFFALLDAMQTNFVAGGGFTAQQNATPAGYQALGRLGVATDSGRVTTDVAAGNRVVKAVLSCMAVDGYAAIAATVDFTAALGSTGLFGVRAGNLATAVISRGDDVNGEPLFGAEPSGPQWHATAPFILFWGYPIQTSSFTNETNGGQAFQLNELPTLSFPKVFTSTQPPTLIAGPIKLGVCRMEEGARILHEHSNADVILPDADEPNFCTNPPIPTSPVGFRGIMQRVGDWLAPQPLYAFAFGGGGSALVEDLSPSGPVTFEVETINFVYTIPDAKTANTNNQFGSKVAVVVKSANLTPIANVKVTLEVIGNFGSYTTPTDLVRYTDKTGTAVFSDFYLDKSGSYTIYATTDEFGGFRVPSNQFNVTGPPKK